VKAGGARVMGLIIPLLDDQKPVSEVEESIQQPVVILESSKSGVVDISAKWRTCVFPSAQDAKLFVTGGDIKFLLVQAVEEGEGKTRENSESQAN
jgi:hypothetical protein